MSNDRKIAIWTAAVALTIYPLAAAYAFTGPTPSGGWMIVAIGLILLVLSAAYWKVNRGN